MEVVADCVQFTGFAIKPWGNATSEIVKLLKLGFMLPELGTGIRFRRTVVTAIVMMSLNCILRKQIIIPPEAVLQELVA